jgi:hypothetical protein
LPSCDVHIHPHSPPALFWEDSQFDCFSAYGINHVNRRSRRAPSNVSAPGEDRDTYTSRGQNPNPNPNPSLSLSLVGNSSPVGLVLSIPKFYSRRAERISKTSESTQVPGSKACRNSSISAGRAGGRVSGPSGAQNMEMTDCGSDRWTISLSWLFPNLWLVVEVAVQGHTCLSVKGKGACLCNLPFL